MIAARNLTPRQVWAMRVDEAVRLCLGRTRLMQRSAAASQAAAQAGHSGSGPRIERTADGRFTMRIDSMDKLASFLQGGVR